MKRRTGPTIAPDELAFFHRQLASMARLDLPFSPGLRTLAKEVEGTRFRAVIDDVLEDLEEGKRLSDALARRNDVFSDLYLGIVRAGEESGDLASALDGLANYSESMLFLRQRVKAALAYPTVALLITLGLVFFVFSTIIPRFREVYASLDMDLPRITTVYLEAATLMHQHVNQIVGGILALVVAVLVARRFASGARTLTGFSLNLPFYGKLLRQVLLLRFCETLRALLVSRVSLVPALRLTSRTMGENVLRDTVTDMAVAAEEGKRMSDVLGRNSMFPRTFVWKFALAEEQGTLETTLEELTRYIRMEVSSLTTRLSALLEPFLIAVVGLTVGSVVFSVFAPIFDLQRRLAAH